MIDLAVIDGLRWRWAKYSATNPYIAISATPQASKKMPELLNLIGMSVALKEPLQFSRGPHHFSGHAYGIVPTKQGLDSKSATSPAQLLSILGPARSSGE